MADQSLNVDGYASAAVNAASKWLELALTITDLTLAVDGYQPAAVTPGKWLQATMNGEQRATINFWTIVGRTWEVTIFKMRGMDAAIDGLYDTWTVEGDPDTDASEYTGALVTPLRDVVVIDSWITTT